MSLLTHYTLNTGHSRESPRSEVGDDTIELCRKWTVPGDFELPPQFPGWRLKVTIEGGLLATLTCERMPVATLGVANTAEVADKLWPALESFYHTITDLPIHRSADWQPAKQPPMLPWLSVILIDPSDIYTRATWLGDFERCMAWAWVEEQS